MDVKTVANKYTYIHDRVAVPEFIGKLLKQTKQVVISIPQNIVALGDKMTSHGIERHMKKLIRSKELHERFQRRYNKSTTIIQQSSESKEKRK